MRLTQQRLKDLFHYDENTGNFTRKVTKGGEKVGTIAGHYHLSAYHKIKVDNTVYFTHRLAWLYVYGYMPENEVDHINGITADNRICNLREVSKSCNLRNSKPIHANNTSGVNGISKKDNGWVAQIHHKKSTTYIGYYLDFDDAVCARYAAEQCLDWNVCSRESSAEIYLKNRGIIKN